MTWLIIEGERTVPVCLLEAAKDVDCGPVVYRDEDNNQGHELLDELRSALGNKIIELCTRYVDEPYPPEAVPQTGEATHYRRRRPEDSRLDPELSIAEQFDLLRTVDNRNYPAFFDFRGHRYKLIIEKLQPDEEQ